MRSMLSGEGFYSCSILFQLIHDRYVKMLLDTNGGFAPEAALRSRQDEVHSSLDSVEKVCFD